MLTFRPQVGVGWEGSVWVPTAPNLPLHRLSAPSPSQPWDPPHSVPQSPAELLAKTPARLPAAGPGSPRAIGARG